jgi:hypothetical protein
MELVTEMTVAERQGLLPRPKFEEAYEQSGQIARMLSGLRSSLLASSKQ